MPVWCERCHPRDASQAPGMADHEQVLCGDVPMVEPASEPSPVAAAPPPLMDVKVEPTTAGEGDEVAPTHTALPVPAPAAFLAAPSVSPDTAPTSEEDGVALLCALCGLDYDGCGRQPCAAPCACGHMVCMGCTRAWVPGGACPLCAAPVRAAAVEKEVTVDVGALLVAVSGQHADAR